MKTRTRIKLLIFLIASFAVCLFAGCKIGEMTKDEFLKQNNAENQCVTYFANGGSFNDTAARTKLYIYYQANSYIMCSETNNFKVARTNFTFDAWYYIDVDGDGNPGYDADGNIILSTRKLEPTDRVPENKHLYVAAGWNANVAINIRLVTESGFEIEDKDGKKYKSGDVINTVNFGAFSSYNLDGKYDALETVNATYLYFFKDKECTEPIVTVNKPTEGDAEFVDVYAKYIEGEWNIVRTPADVRSMFIYSYDNTRRCPNYYLFTADNSGVIDCESENAVGLANSTFAINIEGNGVIIDNLKFSNVQSTALTGGKNSILGKLGASSAIKNLTLRNVTLTAQARSGNPEICVVCSGYEEGTKSENFAGFNIENVTAQLSSASGATIYNIQGRTDCWLFGAYGELTDDEFAQEFTGVTVSGASLIVNNETVVENKSINKED